MAEEARKVAAGSILMVLTPAESPVKASMEEREEYEEAPRPAPWGALYVKPMESKENRHCDNCMMWSKDDRCAIHAEDQEVKHDDICGYHVVGKPMDKRMEHEGMEAVDPEYSGLDNVPDGTACDNCKWYEAHGENMGLCHALEAGGTHAPVQAKGCCARWEHNPPVYRTQHAGRFGAKSIYQPSHKPGVM